MKKILSILLTAIIITAVFAGCGAQTEPAASAIPSPASADPTTDPTPDPAMVGYSDADFETDTEVFGYLKEVAEDTITVTVKGEDINYIIADKTRFAKEISTLEIVVGDYLLVTFSVEGDVHYMHMLGKAIPPAE